MTHSPLKPDRLPSDPLVDTEDAGDTEEARDDRQAQEAKDALRRSFEHGAPETGPGDDLDIERGD